MGKKRKKCQKEAWPLHTFRCRPGQSIKTAYHLLRAIAEDEIPTDQETRRDYGFTRAAALGWYAECYLLGLYKGLLVILRVSPDDLHRWRLEGRLVEHIKSVYEPVPPEYRGEYYPWFLQHQYLLEAPGHKSATVDILTLPFRAAWSFAHASFDHIRVKVWGPSPNRAYFELWIQGLVPSPFISEWMRYGFLSTFSEAEMSDLDLRYRYLFFHHSFEEFCAAYRTSGIPALFDRHSLPCSILFRDVMSCTPWLPKTVWRLKYYIDLLAAVRGSRVGARLDLTSAVASDYGFANCRTDGDAKLLSRIYTHYFSHPGTSPLDLHEACMEGTLLEYLEPFIEWKPTERTRCRKLLKNIYPPPWWFPKAMKLRPLYHTLNAWKPYAYLMFGIVVLGLALYNVLRPV
ncbi:hypothetical protein ONZ51_g9083 [Trametes cubensis]|uniref:Uncharacterized protein n=1 Tax=Trametes cubensis TaxID=1111947 RepID=A0AAD7TN94_9APHY|nr:hypothetical protein ONZ51_g9083 [Trametes cubensis]